MSAGSGRIIVTAGGASSSSARITADNAVQQLSAQMGFTFNGNATWDWDDAGYFVAYGARVGGFVDSAATVAVVPTAGRYRVTVHGEFAIASLGAPNASALAWIFVERDSGGAEYALFESVIVKPPGSPPGGSWDATLVIPLAAGGCIGIWSYNAQDASLDIFSGFMAIEKIG